MLDAKYFRTAFAAAAKTAGPRMRAELHLESGAVFEIGSVHAIEEGHVVLMVYPPEEGEAAAQRARGEPAAADAAGATDQLAVSYESISCVHFTPAARHLGRSAGF